MTFNSGTRPIQVDDISKQGVPRTIGREMFAPAVGALKAAEMSDKEYDAFVKQLPRMDGMIGRDDFGEDDAGRLDYQSMLDGITKIPAARDRFVATAIKAVKARFDATNVTPENSKAWRGLTDEARVFHIRYMSDLAKMIESYPNDSQILHVAPYPVFKIVVDQPYLHEWHDSKGAMDITGIVPLEWIVDAREDPWQIYGRNRIIAEYHPDAEDGEIFALIREGVTGEYKFELIDGPMPFNPETGEVDEAMLMTVASHIVAPDLKATNISSAHVARAFCAFINHVGLTATRIADPDRPPNRQQRRAANYVENPHYRVLIRGRVERLAKELAEGKNIRERREHDVRQHLRTNRAGVKAIRVRPHRRCRGKKEFIQREYETSVEYTPDA